MKFINSIIGSTLIALFTQARRHLDDPITNGKRIALENDLHPDVENALETRRSPLVEAGTCNKMCIFNDRRNQWCFNFKSPTLEAGWSWK